MSKIDTTFLGRRMQSFRSSPEFDGFSKVVIIVSDEIEYSAGTDSGRTLRLSCPWGTPKMAQNILDSIRGFQYQPYTAENAMLDPAAELGDGVTANNVYGGIYTQKIKFGSLLTATIAAPEDEEIDHEYPYKSKPNREITRVSKQLRASLAVEAARISAEIEERKSAVETLTAMLEIQAEKIEAKVSKTGGNASSFGWILTDSSWTIQANNQNILKATKTGLEVYGKITATSGKIGGFDIKSDYLSYNKQTWDGTNSSGIYLGIKGIQLGKKFKVDSTGNLTASSGTFSGTINANSGTIGGFAIKSSYISYNNQTWGGTKATGVYVGTNGIQLGKNFKVDSAGNLTATSGTFSGSVYAGSIRYGDDYGTLDGSGVTNHSVTGDTIDYGTITTSNIGSGIKTSLSYADYANGVFSGWNIATTMSAYSVSGNTVFADTLNVSDKIYFGVSRVYLGTITDRDGNTQRVVMWSD